MKKKKTPTIYQILWHSTQAILLGKFMTVNPVLEVKVFKPRNTVSFLINNDRKSKPNVTQENII